AAACRRAHSTPARQRPTISSFLDFDRRPVGMNHNATLSIRPEHYRTSLGQREHHVGARMSVCVAGADRHEREARRNSVEELGGAARATPVMTNLEHVRLQ